MSHESAFQAESWRTETPVLTVDLAAEEIIRDGWVLAAHENELATVTLGRRIAVRLRQHSGETPRMTFSTNLHNLRQQWWEIIAITTPQQPAAHIVATADPHVPSTARWTIYIGRHMPPFAMTFDQPLSVVLADAVWRGYSAVNDAPANRH